MSEEMEPLCGEKERTATVHPDCPYVPRNGYVVCEIFRRDTGSGLAMPDAAIEGKENIVRAFGPDVKDLELGDPVLAIGSHGEGWAFLPGTNKFFMALQDNIAIKMREVSEKDS